MTSILAAIYLRISDADADDFDAIKRQSEDALKIIERNGWGVYTDDETKHPEFAGAFVDHSLSASKRSVRRPAFERMMTAIREGRVHAIVGYDLDRITRQPRQLEDLIDMAADHGLIVKTLQSDYDLSTEDGRLHARIKATIAKNEVEQKAKRQKRSNDQRIAAAIPVPTRRPYGYLNGGKVPHPDERLIVERIFAELIAGQPLALITRRLNEDGVPMSTASEARNGKWNRQTVLSIVLNERYAGLTTSMTRTEVDTLTARQRYLLRRDRSRWMASAAITPIIERETLEAAHDIVLDPARRPARDSNRRKYYLTGVGRCSVCDAKWGSRMGSRAASYKCSADDKHPAIDLGAVERGVAMAVGFCLATRAADILERLGASAGIDMGAVRVRLAEIAADRADIMEDRAAGLITAAESRPHLQRLAAERAKLEEAVAEAHRSNVSTAVLARLAAKYRDEQPQTGEYANETPRGATLASAARIARDFLMLDVMEKSNVAGTLFHVTALRSLDELGHRRTPDERLVIEDRLLA